MCGGKDRMKDESHIVIICGKKDEGKTTFIKCLIDRLKPAGISMCGLYSPGIYEENQKIGIAVTDLTTNRHMQLAKHEPGWDPKMPAREWRFNEDALAWGDQVLFYCINQTSDVLIIDEIGYLELQNEGGWKSVFPVVEQGNYLKVYLVVRDGLLGQALKIWSNAQIVAINQIDSIDRWLSNEIKTIMELKGTRTNQFQKPR